MLILLLLFNSCGFIFIYYQVQNILKQTAAFEISRKEFHTNIEVLALVKNNFADECIKEGEFKYNGKMFDIVAVIQNEDNVILYCIPDHNEEILNKVFNDNVDQQSSAAKPVKNIIKLLVQDGLINIKNFIIEIRSEFNYKNNSSPKPHKTTIEVLLPPPLIS